MSIRGNRRQSSTVLSRDKGPPWPCVAPSLEDQDYRPRWCARIRSGDCGRKPHFVPRLNAVNGSLAPPSPVCGQGRIHGRLEDQTPVSCHGHDSHRSKRWLSQPQGPRCRRRSARQWRHFWHLPRRNTIPRRKALQGAHWRRSARATHRGRSCSGGHRRHRQDPTPRG